MKVNMNTILRTEHLCKYYGSGENEVRAVDDVNIAIGRGEFVAVVGKSGSGKSTLLHLLGGLDYPTGGKVYVGDMELFSLKEDALAVFRRRKMGFVFQAFNLVSSINVWENIVLPAGLDGRRCDTAFVKDSRTSDEVIGLMKMSAQKYGQTLVMITHDEDIAQSADRVIVIEDGKVGEMR